MKLEKAIELNRAEVDALIDAGEVATAQAVELGIEALKRIEDIRNYDGDYSSLMLPGETKE